MLTWVRRGLLAVLAAGFAGLCLGLLLDAHSPLPSVGGSVQLDRPRVPPVTAHATPDGGEDDDVEDVHPPVRRVGDSRADAAERRRDRLKERREERREARQEERRDARDDDREGSGDDDRGSAAGDEDGGWADADDDPDDEGDDAGGDDD